MKTLPEYCEQTIKDKVSFTGIGGSDINRDDTDIKDMTTSIIKSMNAQKIYQAVKLTPEGIRFFYMDHKFFLRYDSTGVWVLTNKTMQDFLESEAYENRWHKYDDFTCLPQQDTVPDTQYNQE